MKIEVTMTSSLLLLDYQKYLTSNGIVHGPISDVLLDETPKNVWGHKYFITIGSVGASDGYV